MSDVISAEGIKKLLSDSSLPVYVFDVLDSTNLFAKALPDPFALVVADSQTQGRGRLGRSFFSPKGAGVYLSLKVQVDDLYKKVPFITTLASVATHRAIKALYNIDCGIKWVNDIYIGTKKVAGILCEGADATSAIIGIGINVYPSSLPEDLKTVATYLTNNSSTTTRNELIALIVNNLISLLSDLPDTAFMDYYKAHSIVIGKKVLFTLQGNTTTAVAVDITDSGALVVQTAEGLLTLSTGEVTIRFTD